MARRIEDPIKETRVFEYPGMTIRVHIPDLTVEEREKRQKELKRVATEFMRHLISVTEND